MAHVFEQLSLWIDPVPRDGPAQMACDEALLQKSDGVVLRVFRWSEPWVSIGYFTPWQGASEAGRPVCRRWTGGGVVVHEEDFTFALIAPRSEGWARLRPEESYRVVHAALAGALREAGHAATLFANAARGGAACFAGPVRHDVVDERGKIAGGAQRRTKRGLLHQGSVQAGALGPEFARTLAGALAVKKTMWTPPEDFEDAVSALARGKYAREEFLRRVDP